jgi:hypothetical protein
MTAITFKISGNPLDPEETKALAEAISPYCLDKTYSVCVPCWMRKLGVKP